MLACGKRLLQPQPFDFAVLSCRIVNGGLWGTIMYTLAGINFSEGLGVVVGELPPDEMDRQEQKLAENDIATAPQRASDLELAVFAAP